MEEREQLLHQDLILLDYEAESRDDLLIKLSTLLKEKGYVKDTYTDGILEREKIFPTGLNTEEVKIAIPHTDAKHVNMPAILVAKLKKPVSFKEMGNGINDVNANLVFMLAVKNPELQVKTLSKLMSIFCNKSKLLDIYNSTTKEEVIGKLSEIMA